MNKTLKKSVFTLIQIILVIALVIKTLGTLMAAKIVQIEDKENEAMLKTRADNVSFPLSDEDSNLIEQMKNKLYELGGVGLAAPQINKGKRIIAIYIPKEASLMRDNVIPYSMHVLINPEYKGIEKGGKSSDFEGCYSVRSKMGKVERFNEIYLTYQDEQGIFHKKTEEGFYARVLQHEIDHINGVLIIDRLGENDIQGTQEEMMSLRRKELPEDKRELFDELANKRNKR